MRQCSFVKADVGLSGCHRQVSDQSLEVRRYSRRAHPRELEQLSTLKRDVFVEMAADICSIGFDPLDKRKRCKHAIYDKLRL